MLAPSGRGVLGAGVALYGAGWALGYPEAVVLGFACLLAVAGAVAWTLPRPRLAVQRSVIPRKVSRGDVAEGVVTLVNEGRRIRRGLRATDVCGDETVTVDVPAMTSGASHQVRYRLPTARRGEIPVGPLRLVRTDPLGLGRRVQQYGALDTLLVRPRTAALPLLPSGKAHHVEGPTSSQADDGTITFHALREYVLGDDLRRVHWRSTARTGTLMVRQMVDVSLPHTTIVLDTRPAAYPAEAPTEEYPRAGEPFELAVDTAASIAVAAAGSNFPVNLVTGGGHLIATEGSANDSGTLLDRLAIVTPTPDGSLAQAFDAVAHGRPGGSLIVVTGVGDASGLGRVSTVRRRFERIVLVRVGRDGGAAGAAGADGSSVPGDVPLLPVNSLEDLVSRWRWESVR
jgi:uncharacterized protein (DUF58 family)